ncbi:hypothetical protein PORY_001720 [Pneumocystis oryctolagi]|uniref:Uncharacterized protein n=1 Tax=Pneumocystis oryctolagi TaxID=42067 RepID=A0ACB7CC42_9ASCO|nr:hypothetical protein PORY_001720 [Pneumocystis oryctolagi]
MYKCIYVVFGLFLELGFNDRTNLSFCEMYSFEGNYKSKRIVNLGRKQKESKELLLRKVADDRKKRYDERRKENAVLKKIIRSKISIKRAKESFRYDFDHDISEYKSSLKFSEKNDFYRLRNLIEIILKESEYKDISFSDIVPGISLWIVWNFGHILMKSLNLTNDVVFHKYVFGLLPNLVCLNISLINLGYYKELCLYVCTNGITVEFSFMQLFTLAVIKPLRYFYMFEYSLQKIVLSGFIMSFFVLTKKYDYMLNSVICQLESFFSRLIFLRVVLDIDFDCFSKEELLWILHNVLLYVINTNDTKLRLSSLDEIDLYSRCISEILIRILKRANVLIETCRREYDSDDEDNCDILEIAFCRIIPEKLFSELNVSILFSTEHIVEIITYVFPSTVVNISKLFVVLMEFWPFRKSEIMTQLVIYSTGIDECNNRNILFVLWERVKSDIKALESDGCIDLCENIFFLRWNEQWYTMILLLELYSRILTTMVDDEFFDPMKNFIVFDNIKILDVSYLLYCRTEYFETYFRIHNTYWFNTVRLRNLVTKLIQQLFIRDSRRQFFPHDYWLLNNRIDMTMFASSVISELLKSDEKFENNNQETCYSDNILDSAKSYINVLRKFPFYIPFSVRIHILHSLINYDMETSGHSDPWNVINRFSVTIRRDNIFQDGFSTLYNIGKDIKKPINIIFVDRYGLPEAGIDGGGITKEFLVRYHFLVDIYAITLFSICKQALDIDFGLFYETREHFYAIAMLIGKCIYESILIDVTFAPFFLMKLLGKMIDDLFVLDTELYEGLLFLKRYTGDVENDLFLNFTVIQQEFGKSTVVELIPGGSDISVTKKNRLQYIYTMADYRLNKVIFKQSSAFLKGLSEIIDIKWLSMFSCQELQNLIGGSSVPIDIDDLRNNSVYGGFKYDDPVIELFWSVVYEFSDLERRLLLKFVTSVSRPPLLGFKDLKPLFCIRDGGNDINRLPTASTCINLLILPRYNDRVVMRSKLLYAVNFDAGLSNKDLDFIDFNDAVLKNDFIKLRKYAIQGFDFNDNNLRKKIWNIFICPQNEIMDIEIQWKSLPAHKDENQVQLDVDRSFIYYPTAYENYPPFLNKNQKDFLISELIDYVQTHGILMRLKPLELNKAYAFKHVNIPVAIYPSLFPLVSFKKAKEIQCSFNKLYAFIANDEEFMTQIMKNLNTDDFIKNLWNIYLEVKNKGIVQIANDLSPQLKQIEFNTIASSMPALAYKTQEMHRYLYNIGAYGSCSVLKESSFPENNPIKSIAKGFAIANKLYGGENTKILFVVEPYEPLFCDQRLLEYELFQVQNTNISRVFIFGYSPTHYPSSTEWSARLLIEESKAIKCPTIMTQLSGCKKIQQVLCQENIIERFLPKDESNVLKETFVSIYSLDTNLSNQEVYRLLMDNPQNYILKPQREGGGNNIYGPEIINFLRTIPESHKQHYILMERIYPPSHANTIIRNNEIHDIDSINELGIYGIILWNSDHTIHYNEESGYLIRIKDKKNNEGGLVAGYSSIDSCALIS